MSIQETAIKASVEGALKKAKWIQSMYIISHRGFSCHQRLEQLSAVCCSTSYVDRFKLLSVESSFARIYRDPSYRPGYVTRYYVEKFLRAVYLRGIATLGLLKKEATNLLIVARLSVKAKGLSRYESLFEGKPLSVKIGGFITTKFIDVLIRWLQLPLSQIIVTSVSVYR